MHREILGSADQNFNPAKGFSLIDYKPARALSLLDTDTPNIIKAIQAPVSVSSSFFKKVAEKAKMPEAIVLNPELTAVQNAVYAQKKEAEKTTKISNLLHDKRFQVGAGIAGSLLLLFVITRK